MKTRFHIPLMLAGLLGGATAVLGQGRDGSELRGSILSAETGEVVAGAWLGLEGEPWGTFSWNDGHFHLPEVPGRPASYEVRALGYETTVVTLDPSAGPHTVELAVDSDVHAGLTSLMQQLQRRRNRGGQLRVFDRETLAFSGAYSLGDLLSRHRVRGVRQVCLNERPGTLGVLEREGHEFYLVETFGALLRIYTEDFLLRAASERLQLQREPSLCSGPVS